MALAAVRLWPGRRAPARLWVVACVLSVLPDADVALFHLGVDYAHAFGHRGFFHSPAFAALAALAAAQLLFPAERRRVFTLLLLVGASHGVLDAMTDGGLGIAFLAPFDDARYFLPWRPLVVAPLDVASFFSGWGLAVLASEFAWVWLPLAAVLAGAELARAGRRGAGAGRDGVGPKTARLCAELREAIAFLEVHGQAHWAGWLRDCLRLLEASDARGLERLLGAYGGMGSFNDLLLGDGAADTRLQTLRTRLHALATEIRAGQGGGAS